MPMTFCFAIAAARFDRPSETFIRAHARQLAPGRTVLLCQKAPVEPPIAAPILDSIRGHGSAGERVVKAWRYGMEACGFLTEPGLRHHDRDRVAAFLSEHGVETMLVEYGWLGYKLMGAARDAGVRLYVHFHGYDATMLPLKRRWRRRYPILFAAADGIVTPSRYIADQLQGLGCPAEKLLVSPCGVEPGLFQPTSREPGRVLGVGRLTEKKAPHLTLEAFARVRAMVPDAHLDLVGDGELRPQCEEMVRRHGLADAVTLHGVQPPTTVATLMGRASLFVQHSMRARDGDMEGLPVSILEAMSAALPVVATRHSGIPEAVAEGATGLLVEEQDVAGMAAAIIALLTDPEQAATMGKAGRERVLEYFTQEHMRRRLIDGMGLEMPIAKTPFLELHPT